MGVEILNLQEAEYSTSRDSCGMVFNLGHHVYKDGKWTQNECVEPLDPSWWAGPSWAEARGAQGPVSEVNEMITHWEEMCKTHNFLRATRRYWNELEVHHTCDEWSFFGKQHMQQPQEFKEKQMKKLIFLKADCKVNMRS